MRRRNFLSGLGGAVAASWPLMGEAQQPMPTIGYLSARSLSNSTDIVAAFREGLKEAGFVDGQNIQLPVLAADLVRRQVNVIVATGGTVAVVKVKPVVPSTIPLVFAMGGDPVKLGVVATINRPGGNVTGVAFLVNGLAGKQVELLHQLVPNASVIGLLVNPKDPNAQSDARDARAAANTFGKKLVVGEASTENEIQSCFVSFAQQHVGPSSQTPNPSYSITVRILLPLQLRMRYRSFRNFDYSQLMVAWRHMELALLTRIVCLVSTRAGS